MESAIEISSDEFALLRLAASAPLRCDSLTIRQRCLNLESRALLQRIAGPGGDSLFRPPTFALTWLGWRRLRETVRRSSRPQLS